MGIDKSFSGIIVKNKPSERLDSFFNLALFLGVP